MMKKRVFLVFMPLILAGCGTTPKEVSAPCKRPAVQTAYAEAPRRDCGPMESVNGEPSAALAAIDALLSH